MHTHTRRAYGLYTFTETHEGRRGAGKQRYLQLWVLEAKSHPICPDVNTNRDGKLWV